MAGIPRATQEIFADSGLTPTDGFGAAAAGNLGTENGSVNSVSNLQTGTSSAWTSGLLAAVLGGSKFPAVEDLNAIFNVITNQLGYVLARGIAEYDAGTTYNTGDICKGIATSVLYKSVADSNTGQSLTNAAYWLECGDLTSLSAGNVPVPADSPVPAANLTFASGNNGLFIRRSNSGSAMADTLPGTTGALSNGWFCFLYNDDAAGADVINVGSGGAIYYGDQDLSSSGFTVLPGEIWYLQSRGSGDYSVLRLTGAQLNAAPVQSSFKGLSAAWASNTTFTLAASEIILEDSKGNTRKVKNFSQTIDSSVSGAGGLDTGTLAASTWYYGYAIFNPATGTQKGLMSASATSPTLPSGYTLASGPLTAAYNDSSKNLIGFTQKGRDWQYKVGSNLTSLPALASGALGNVSNTWSAAPITTAVPTAIAGTIRVQLWTNANGIALAAPNNSYGFDGSGSAVTTPPVLDIGGNAGNGFSAVAEWVIESSNVYYAAQESGAALYCQGFTLNI